MKKKIVNQLKHDYGQYLTNVNGSTLTMKPPHNDFILTMKVKAWGNAYTVGLTTLKHGAIRTKDHAELDDLITEVRKALYHILGYNPERRENERDKERNEVDKELLKIGWIKNDNEYIRNYPNTSYYEILRFDTEKMFTAFTGNGSPLSLTFNELKIIYKKAKELWK